MFSIINEVMYIRNYITDYKCGCVYKNYITDTDKLVHHICFSNVSEHTHTHTYRVFFFFFFLNLIYDKICNYSQE